MIDPAAIDYVSKIDFSKGFQHFHIQWPLKDLMLPKRSSKFETTVACGDQSVTLSWSLGIEKDEEEPTKTWFVVFSEMFGRITPIIARLSLSSYGNVLFDQYYMVIADHFGQGTSTTEIDKFGKEGGLVLSFWMDVPKSVALGNNIEGRELCASESVAGFILDAGKIFSRVVKTESDAASDVTLIITDKEEKEIRRFQCHTIFLVARSTVFERMFASDKWKENCAKNDRSVKINDISEPVMEMVLRYIYTSDLPDISTRRFRFYGIIYAADKYNLDILKNWCISRLIFDNRFNTLELLVPNRYEQLILADRHTLIQWKSVCLAQLSLCYLIGFPDHINVDRSDLWSEIMQAVSERQANTTDIVLPEA